MADRVRELLQLLDDGRRVRSGLERASGRATELLEAEGRAGRAPHPWRGKPRLAREFRALSNEARRLSVLATSVSLRAEWGGGAACCSGLSSGGGARVLAPRAATSLARHEIPTATGQGLALAVVLVQVALWCVPLWMHHREQGKEPGEAGPSRRCDS